MVETAIKESNQEKFIHYLSHDLREPARMVSQFLKLVKDRSVNSMDKKSGEFLEYAIDASQKMDRMIQSLSDISRVKNVKDNFSLINTSEILNSVKEELSGPIELRSAKIVLKGDEQINTRKNIFKSVLKELLSNSLQHAEVEGCVEIEVNIEQKDKGVEFSVEDNGPVVSDYWKEKAFQLFQKKDQQSLNTGIGLTKCKLLVEKYDGFLSMSASDSNKTVVNCIIN